MAYAKIRPRRGMASEWTSVNPTLLEGEMGIEVPSTGIGTGLVKMKFGDGVTPWNDLPYGVVESDFDTAYGNSIHVVNSKEAPALIDIYGKTEQETTTGKNLFALDPLTEQTINGVTFTPVYADNGALKYINVNGTATAEARYYLNNGNLIITGGDYYTLSGCPKNGGASSYYLSAGYAGADRGNGNTELTSTGEKTIIAYIIVASGTVINNLKFYPQIEKGKVVTDYEPYTDGASPNTNYKQDLKSVVLSEIRTCGKNLWNYGDLWSRSFIYLCPINKGESVTLSYDFVNDDSGYDVRYGLYVMDSVNNWTIDNIVDHYADNKVISSVNGRNVITVTNNTYSVGYLYFRQIVPTGYARLSNIQVEVGSTATPYEPYTESVVTLSEPITLNGFNGVGDYIDAKRGVLVQKFNSVVFNGSENWSYTSGSNYHQFYTLVSKALNSEAVICSHFSTMKISERGTKTGFISYHDNTFRFALLPEDNITSENEWKEWLTNNNVTVIYKLAEPIETPLPDEDIEALRNLISFEGVTNVYNDGNADMAFTYATNKNSVLTLEDHKTISEHEKKINELLTALGGLSFVPLSESEYEALTDPDDDTVYIALED